jgi:dCMP deaminase
MTCKNCDPSINVPGRLIKVVEHLTINGDMVCKECGAIIDKAIIYTQSHNKWDAYFRNICNAVATKSPCLSRNIGAILVRDKSIISTGYNGPARGIPHCTDICPRRKYGYVSGTHMEMCLAQHAEENCISNAARSGVSTVGSTLYMNTYIPCKNCLSTLINAGIVEVVIDEIKFYDKYTQFVVDNSSIKIRLFEI